MISSYRNYGIKNCNCKTVRLFIAYNYSLEIENLSRCILYGEKPHITPAFSIRNAELIDRILGEIGYYFVKP
jgi:hypothetical protein